jgi:hypothetical protein
VPRSLSKKEERKWARLQLAIPVFVRARMEMARIPWSLPRLLTSLLGVLWWLFAVLCRKSALVSLEIPSAPIGPAEGLKASADHASQGSLGDAFR